MKKYVVFIFIIETIMTGYKIMILGRIMTGWSITKFDIRPATGFIKSRIIYGPS